MAAPTPPGGPTARKAPPAAARAAVGLESIGQYQVVPGSFVNVQPGTIQPLQVDCPAGTNVLSGGAYNDDFGGVVLVASHPDSTAGRGWRAAVHNRRSTVVRARAYAICGSGVDSYVTDAWEWFQPGNGSIGYFCQKDGQVLGGGQEVQNLANVPMRTSYPKHHITNRWMWEISARNDSGAPQNYRVWRVCGAGIANYRVVSAGTDIPGGGYRSAGITCDPGTSVLGGGAYGFTGEGADVVLTDSYPAANGWQAWGRNDGPGPHGGLTVFAICGN